MFSDSTGPNQWVPFDSRVDFWLLRSGDSFASGPCVVHMVWTCLDLLTFLQAVLGFLVISGDT